MNSGHWYDLRTGEPKYFIPKKDGTGNRKTTLADARKHDWVPGVTYVIDILRKPGLERYFIEQAVHAVVTAPDIEGEGLDAKINRVLEVEQQQDQEAQSARDRGTAIHAALACYFIGQAVDSELLPWIEPAAKALCQRGQYVCCEKVLVGNGYAGRCDLILESRECFWIVDHKTTKTLPTKGAYPEATIQCSAYAAAFAAKLPGEITHKPVRTVNAYISTVEQGKFVLCDHDPDWQRVYNNAFVSLLKVWCYLNNYYPAQ